MKANKMRSKIEANEYKDYILGFIFYKFLSDKEVKFLTDNSFGIEDMKKITENDTEVVEYIQKNLGYFIEYNNLFSTWIEIKGDFDVSNVTNMRNMFQGIGKSATSLNIGDLSNWNVSNVTNMGSMFGGAGYSATEFNIGNLSNWNVSSVTDMQIMFNEAGYSATSFNIGNLSGWDVSNVKNMQSMFRMLGYNATSFNIGDISGWNVNSVISYTWFNSYVGDRIIAPVWVNEDQGYVEINS